MVSLPKIRQPHRCLQLKVQCSCSGSSFTSTALTHATSNQFDGASWSTASRRRMLKKAVRVVRGWWWWCRRDSFRKLSAACTVCFLVNFIANLDSAPDQIGGLMTELKTDGNIQTIQRDLSDGVATLILELTRPAGSSSDDKVVAVGQHVARVIINNKSCTYPRFWMRLVGDVLVTMEFRQGAQSKLYHWNGSFAIPMEGNYSVEARWYGCAQNGTSWSLLQNPIEIQAIGPPYTPVNQQKESYLFANSGWISHEKVPFSGALQTGYVWTDLDIGEPDPDDFVRLVDEKSGIRTIVSKRGTFKKQRACTNSAKLGTTSSFASGAVQRCGASDKDS